MLGHCYLCVNQCDETEVLKLEIIRGYGRRGVKTKVECSPTVVTTPHIQFPNRCRDGPL
jgi:hypothetical protein